MHIIFTIPLIYFDVCSLFKNLFFTPFDSSTLLPVNFFITFDFFFCCLLQYLFVYRRLWAICRRWSGKNEKFTEFHCKKSRRRRRRKIIENCWREFHSGFQAPSVEVTTYIRKLSKTREDFPTYINFHKTYLLLSKCNWDCERVR